MICESKVEEKDNDGQGGNSGLNRGESDNT